MELVSPDREWPAIATVPCAGQTPTTHGGHAFPHCSTPLRTVHSARGTAGARYQSPPTLASQTTAASSHVPRGVRGNRRIMPPPPAGAAAPAGGRSRRVAPPTGLLRSVTTSTVSVAASPT